MKKINKHNYEAYFLDYLEGTLSFEDKHDLMIFLDANPELKSALDIDLNETTLDPSLTVFADKNSLKVDDNSTLTLNSVDYWMIESVEKNLSATKQIELDDFIKRHRLEKSFSAFNSTLLKPDLTEIYREKSVLKVSTGIVIPFGYRIAAAASFLILVGVAISQFSSSESTPTYLHGSNLKTDNNKLEMNVPNHALAKINKSESSIKKIHSDRFNKVNKKEDVIFNDSVLVQQFPKEEIIDTAFKQSDNTPEDVVDNGPQIINENNQDTNNQIGPSYIIEEPYKLVTNKVGDVANKEMHFTRSKDVSTNEYVAYGFQIGNFEFERKKAK